MDSIFETPKFAEEVIKKSQQSEAIVYANNDCEVIPEIYY